MRCCVQNCFNHDSKKTNKSHGITFHKLPKHPDQSTAWLTALAKLGYRMNKSLVVCSEHFLPEDFDDTRPNQRRIKVEAVPTIMAPVIQEDLKVCRVCLALDVKMYQLKDFNLSEMFQNITGISVIEKGTLLQRVCWECAARLTAAAAFRAKALLSDALLKDQVQIKEGDIALLKQHYSSLKSPLSVKTAVTSYDIECEHAISENETNNIFIPNDETAIKERKTKIRINEKNTEFEEHGPSIDVRVKTEVECDPIDQKWDNFVENFNDTSPREDSEDEMINTEAQIDNNGKILRGLIENKAAVFSDGNTIFVENNDDVDKKPKLDGFGNLVYESSSDEDRHSEEVYFNKYKQNMSSNVGIKKEKTTISKNKALHDHLKQRIIALKQEGMSNSRIAHLLGTTRITVRKWWVRWCNEGHMNNHKGTGKKRKTTPQEDQLLIERVAQEQIVHTPSLAKELGISAGSVRKRLREAGFKLQERKASVPLRSGRSHRVDEVTKQQIITMKQNGVSVTDIANQFRVTRTSVYLWWRRWCKENNIKITSDNNTSTTTEQDKGSAEDTNVEKIVQPPLVLSTKKSLWQKVPDVEFMS